MSSYIPPFPNLTFKTVFVAALSYDHFDDSESINSQIIALFAVTSASFYNSSLQANVVSRMKINEENVKLVELFLLPSTTTTISRNLSTIQMTPVLNLRNLRHPQTVINRLKDSTYFSRSLKELTVQCDEPNSLLPALENLVALEVLELSFFNSVSPVNAHDLSVVPRLPSLISLKLKLDGSIIREFGFSDLENNTGFRQLTIHSVSDTSCKRFQSNFARLCANNRLTHLALNYYFTDDDLDVLINAKLANLRSLSITSNAAASPSKIADAVIASSSSLTTLEMDHISDDELIKCAEYLNKLVELRINSTRVNGSFLREKGCCFASKLEILELIWLRLSDEHLKDGFKYLTSLRKLDLRCNQYFDGASSLRHLTAAKSLGELNLSKITSGSLEAVRQLTQLRSLSVTTIGDDVKSDDATHLKNLVNLRKLTFDMSTEEMYRGILQIAESFPKMESVVLGQDPSRKGKKAKFSRDEVVYLLDNCWPLVRHAEFAIADARVVIPYLRRRFPHIDLGYENERMVPVIRQISRSSNTLQVDGEHDSRVHS